MQITPVQVPIVQSVEVIIVKTKKVLLYGRHCAVDQSALTIMRPQVLIPNTTATL